MTSEDRARLDTQRETEVWRAIAAYLAAIGLVFFFMDRTNALTAVVLVIIFGGHFAQKIQHEKRIHKAIENDLLEEERKRRLSAE